MIKQDVYYGLNFNIYVLSLVIKSKENVNFFEIVCYQLQI